MQMGTESRQFPNGDLTQRTIDLRADGAVVDVRYAPFGWRVDAQYADARSGRTEVFVAEDGDLVQLVIRGYRSIVA